MGNKIDSLMLKPYFKELILVESKQNSLTFPFYHAHIIFIDCDDKNHYCLKTIQKIRQQETKNLIVIMGKQLDSSLLLELLPLHLSGYLEKPLKKNNIEKVLTNLISDFIETTIKHSIALKENYRFNIEESMLLNTQRQIVKLTKHEIKLMRMLSDKKNAYVTSETIEHNIWEEASLEKDCNSRLKHLVYCLRKKLPKETLINTYGLGYKLITQ